MILCWVALKVSEFIIALATIITERGAAAFTHTLPFKPVAISNESFFPRASSTGHVGELNNL